MRILVTGAAGFIGSALLRECASLRVEAIALPRDGAAGAADALVHLAEPRDLAVAEAAGEQHIRGIVDSARRLLASFAGRAVYASSGVVYGDAATAPRRPAEPICPAGVYARGKLAVEQVFLARTSAVVARLGNVYGVGMAANNVLADILAQRCAPGPVKVRDTGPVRDYVAVQDVARALLAMAMGAANGVYNVGTGVGHSVAEVVGIICGEWGQPGRATVATAPGGRASTLILDAEATRRDFSWQPTIALREGVRELIRETDQPIEANHSSLHR